MPAYNKVQLIGNLTRDPEVRYTPKGTAVCDFGLAINRVYTDDAGEKKEEVTFVDITLWGRSAENAGKYLSKGRSVFIEGHLQTVSWEDKQTGQKRSRLKVVGESIQFLGSPPESAASTRPTASRAATAPSPPPSGDHDSPSDLETDDIPF